MLRELTRRLQKKGITLRVVDSYPHKYVKLTSFPLTVHCLPNAEPTLSVLALCSIYGASNAKCDGESVGEILTSVYLNYRGRSHTLDHNCRYLSLSS